MNPTLNRNVLVSEGLKSIYLEHHSAVLTDTGEIMTASYESPAVELITDIMQREYVTLGFDVLPERKVKIYEPSLISSLLKEVAQRKTDEKSASDAKSETYGIAMRMLEYAAQHECSDIHIELYKTETRIEMRIDGRMVVYGQIIKDYEWGQHLIAILFYHADIKDDDFNVTKPNNGRITALLKTAQGKRDTDWRMSYMPALNKGGQATLRWLNKSMEIPTLEELGWEAGQRREVRNFMYSKAGVLVFAGQTGSGKTTSIAAMLNEVKRKGRSINTLEDPVEFDLGVIQTSINSQGEGKADFAEYNKLLKRHDVDIGLIGEIRDHSVAMEVSRNGEAGMLMLTSVHTSSSLGTAPTLIEQMQMPPSLISAPGLMKLWMYQTLVRCLCPHCQLTLDEAKKQFSSEQLNRFDKWHSSYPDICLDKIRFHSEKGCDKCIQGESGRTALIELIVLDDDDREFILKRDYLGWGKHLKEKGFKSVIDHANLKIERGEIDLFTAAERVDGLFPRETSTIYRDMWGET